SACRRVKGAVAEAVRRQAVRVAASWARRTALRTLPSSERTAGSTAKRQRTATSVLGDRLGCFWFGSGKALDEYYNTFLGHTRAQLLDHVRVGVCMAPCKQLGDPCPAEAF